jgi:multidrug transporter EmrE-like cation transporter
MIAALLALFAAIAAGCLATSILLTAQHYRALPPEVPDHFDGYGNPDASGPRPTIFTLVFAQAIVAAICFAVALNSLRDSGGFQIVFAIGVIGSAVLVTMTGLQRQIIAVAQRKADKVAHPLRALGIIVAAVIVALASIALFR